MRLYAGGDCIIDREAIALFFRHDVCGILDASVLSLLLERELRCETRAHALATPGGSLGIGHLHFVAMEGEDVSLEPGPLVVGVGVDGSDGSTRAVQFACDLVAENSAFHPTLKLFAVQQRTSALDVLVDPFDTLRIPDEKLKEWVAKRCVDAEEVCKFENVEYQLNIRLTDESAKETLVSMVDASDVDVLVCGSRGMGTVKRLILGSTSEFCLHHCRCSVLIVKPTPDES